MIQLKCQQLFAITVYFSKFCCCCAYMRKVYRSGSHKFTFFLFIFTECKHGIEFCRFHGFFSRRRWPINCPDFSPGSIQCTSNGAPSQFRLKSKPNHICHFFSLVKQRTAEPTNHRIIQRFVAVAGAPNLIHTIFRIHIYLSPLHFKEFLVRKKKTYDNLGHVQDAKVKWFLLRTSNNFLVGEEVQSIVVHFDGAITTTPAAPHKETKYTSTKFLNTRHVLLTNQFSFR